MHLGINPLYLQSVVLPLIVNVFPAPVCPYARIVPEKKWVRTCDIKACVTTISIKHAINNILCANIKHSVLRGILQNFIKLETPIFLLVIYLAMFFLLGNVDTDVACILIYIQVLVGKISCRPTTHYDFDWSLYHLYFEKYQQQKEIFSFIY